MEAFSACFKVLLDEVKKLTDSYVRDTDSVVDFTQSKLGWHPVVPNPRAVRFRQDTESRKSSTIGT